MPLTTFGFRRVRRTLLSVSLIRPRDSRTKRGGRATALPPLCEPSASGRLLRRLPPVTVSGFGEIVVSVVSSSVAT